jgi:hypothetical protein
LTRSTPYFLELPVGDLLAVSPLVHLVDSTLVGCHFHNVFSILLCSKRNEKANRSPAAY